MNLPEWFDGLARTDDPRDKWTIVDEASFLPYEEIAKAMDEMPESNLETVHLFGNMYSIRRKETA
jgi:hypothetical protein